MTDPFRIDSPTCISFSGGRTSALLLWKVLEANGGLPAEAVVCFANTGKEEEATLRFVRDCADRWNVPIAWLEYRNDAAGYAVVDFGSASRAGEPFAAIIAKRQYLPNPVTRFCTTELKIVPMRKHLASLGLTDCNQLIGIRADEPRRVAKIRARSDSGEAMSTPLADAGITVQDVGAFWDSQPFNLGLPSVNGMTVGGNCDLCFLKGAGHTQSLIAQKPARAIWWMQAEALIGARFRKDRPGYAAMLENARQQKDWIGHADEDGIACFCGE
jgi:3'-phosphoadenosine 5'-phosphosulfate sulfotransferase (PAPS reductase)/FAD synthetase